jgi:hypothetical protein
MANWAHPRPEIKRLHHTGSNESPYAFSTRGSCNSRSIRRGNKYLRERNRKGFRKIPKDQEDAKPKISEQQVASEKVKTNT